MADPNRSHDTTGDTPLTEATREGHIACVEALLADPRVDLTVETRSGYTATMIAARKGSKPLLQLLLADPRVDEVSVNKAVAAGIMHGHVHLLAILLSDERVDPNNRMNYGWGFWTPLMAAAYFGHISAVAMLLADDRTRPNEYDHQGETALIISIHYGRYAVLKEILSRSLMSRIKPSDARGRAWVLFYNRALRAVKVHSIMFLRLLQFLLD